MHRSQNCLKSGATCGPRRQRRLRRKEPCILLARHLSSLKSAPEGRGAQGESGGCFEARGVLATTLLLLSFRLVSTRFRLVLGFKGLALVDLQLLNGCHPACEEHAESCAGPCHEHGRLAVARLFQLRLRALEAEVQEVVAWLTRQLESLGRSRTCPEAVLSSKLLVLRSSRTMRERAGAPRISLAELSIAWRP